MKVEEQYTNDGMGFETLALIINDKERFNVYSNYETPEDNSLGRNFNHCFRITDLMFEAYQAGKNGEPFDLVSSEGE